ncbi:MAG: MarR family winged helix-turn-helix transcriptional regulator [Pyramidobacter sp.]|jgi:MarR family transcriptional repressor of emrRAB
MDLKTSLMNLQCEMVAERTVVNPRHISWLQYDILFQLAKEEEILPSKLSVILGISRAKLSKALKDLKFSGYIRQSPNQTDGRELCTSITEEGRSLLADISAEHTALYHTALKALTKDEQEEFSRLSDKVSSALKAERLSGRK